MGLGFGDKGLGFRDLGLGFGVKVGMFVAMKERLELTQKPLAFKGDIGYILQIYRVPVKPEILEP